MQQKEVYHKKLDSQLEEWSSKIDLLAIESTRHKADASIDHEKHIKKLRDQQGTLQEKVAQLKQTHGKNWVNLKNSVEKSAAELKASLDKALLRYV